MATFLFWNMGKKALEESLFRLAMKHEVDVLMLAECAMEPGAVLESLNREDTIYHFPNADKSKATIQVFTRFDKLCLRHYATHSGSRWTFRRLMLPDKPEILLVGVHLNAQPGYDGPSQSSECRDLAEHIRRVEQSVGHKRTLVVGDFNQNPFESGMLDAKALNAEPTRAGVKAKTRIVGQQSYPFFYNPMWNFFGDETDGPAGTFYFRSSRPARLSWNMLDQVLLRPDLLPCFGFENLQILTGDGEDSFLGADGRIKGTPKNRWPDHLPIVFKLDI